MSDNLAEELEKVVERYPDKDREIPIAKMLEYRMQELTYEEIGNLVGCSFQNVSKRLEPYKAAIEGLEAYKGRKSDILHLKGSMLLDALSVDKIKEMSGYQLTGAYGILYDKGNLEDGKPTSLVAYADLCKGAEDVDQRLKDLGVIDMTVEGEEECQGFDHPGEDLGHPPTPYPGGGDEEG